MRRASRSAPAAVVAERLASLEETAASASAEAGLLEGRLGTLEMRVTELEFVDLLATRTAAALRVVPDPSVATPVVAPVPARPDVVSFAATPFASASEPFNEETREPVELAPAPPAAAPVSAAPAGHPRKHKKKKGRSGVVDPDLALLDEAVAVAQAQLLSPSESMGVLGACMFGHCLVAVSTRCPGRTGQCSSSPCLREQDGVAAASAVTCVGCSYCPFEVCEACIVQLAVTREATGCATTSGGQPPG